jgi:hypothetical protein
MAVLAARPRRSPPELAQTCPAEWFNLALKGSSVNETIRTLWRTNRLLVIAFAIALTLTVVFGVRTTAFLIYWSNHQNVPIAGWMPAGYVAKSYRVDIETVREALGLDPEAHDRRPIARIAKDRGVPVEVLISDVNAALKAAEAQEAPEPQ